VVAVNGEPSYSREEEGMPRMAIPIFAGALDAGTATVAVEATYGGKQPNGKAFTLKMRSTYTLSLVPGDKVALRVKADRHANGRSLEEGAYLRWEIGAGAGSLRPIDDVETTVITEIAP
jgi:hypothetical protein